MSQSLSPEAAYRVTAGDVAKRSLLVGVYGLTGWLGYAAADSIEPVTGLPSEFVANAVMGDDVMDDETALGCLAAESGVEVDFVLGERCVGYTAKALDRKPEDAAATPRDVLIGDVQTQLARDEADHAKTKKDAQDALPLAAGGATAYIARRELKKADKKRVKFIEHNHVLEANREVHEVVQVGLGLIAAGDDEKEVKQDVREVINEIRAKQQAAKEARADARKAKPRFISVALIKRAFGWQRDRHAYKIEHRPSGPGQYITPGPQQVTWDASPTPLRALWGNPNETAAEYAQRKDDELRRRVLERLREEQDAIEAQNVKDKATMSQGGFEGEQGGAQDPTLFH